jgi:hypothetical protein
VSMGAIQGIIGASDSKRSSSIIYCYSSLN